MSETLYFIAGNMYYELICSSFSSYVMLYILANSPLLSADLQICQGLKPQTGLKLGMA